MAATEYIATTATVASSAFDTAITPTGLLVEEARTNICLQSEDFTTSWALQAGVVNAGDAIAPDGTLTATQIVDDTAATSVRIRQSLIIASATDYCFSLYAKAEGLDWVALRSEGYDAGGNGYTYYNLGTGALGTSDAAHSNAGIEAAGNGWYRCWFIFQSTTDVSGLIDIYVAEGDGDVSIPADGGSSIHIWGAQLEAGAFPTTYIPTVAASVTRNAEVVLVDDVTWLDNTQGTVYSDHTPTITTTFQQVYAISAASAASRWCTLSNRATKTMIFVADGGSTSVTLGSNATPDGTKSRSAIGLAQNDINWYLNGSSVGSDATTTSFPTNASTLNVGSARGDGTQLNGHIAEIRYYNTRLTNAQLEDMSNGTFPSEGTFGGNGDGFIWWMQ